LITTVREHNRFGAESHWHFSVGYQLKWLFRLLKIAIKIGFTVHRSRFYLLPVCWIEDNGDLLAHGRGEDFSVVQELDGDDAVGREKYLLA